MAALISITTRQAQARLLYFYLPVQYFSFITELVSSADFRAVFAFFVCFKYNKLNPYIFILN